MADTTRSYLITFALIGIFMIAFIGFAIQFSSDNNTNVSILSNTRLNSSYKSIENSLEKGMNTTNAQYNATTQDTITVNADSLTISSIWGSTTSFFFLTTEIGSSILNLAFSLGINYLIIGAIASIIIITLIFLAWKTIRSGD